MPEFYLTGDPHFPERQGAGAWAGAPEIGGDSIHGLTAAVDLCVRDGADLVMPGDIFHGPDPEPGALVPVYEQIRRLGDAGLKAYYVLGNHDRGRDWLAPAGAAAVNVSGRVCETTCGATITGLSWVPTPDAFLDAVGRTRRTDIGVYHQQWAELIKTGQFRLAQLPDHGLCVCGDVHVRAVLDKTTFPRRVVSAGPLSPQSVTEFGCAAVYAARRDGPSGGFAVSEVKLPGRTFVRHDVETADDAEAVMAYLATAGPSAGLPPHLARPMVAVRLAAVVPGFAAAAEKLAADRGVVLYVYAPAGSRAEAGAGSAETAADLSAAISAWPGPAGPESRALAAAMVADGADHKSLLAAAWDRYRAAAEGGCATETPVD